MRERLIARTGGKPADARLAATLSFDHMTASETGLAHPEGQRTAGEFGDVATGGVQMLMFQSCEV